MDAQTRRPNKDHIRMKGPDRYYSSEQRGPVTVTLVAEATTGQTCNVEQTGCSDPYNWNVVNYNGNYNEKIETRVETKRIGYIYPSNVLHVWVLPMYWPLGRPYWPEDGQYGLP